MLVACVGIPVHATAVLLRNFDLAPNVPMCVFIILGWWSMVTGQAVVLYSRLHLVMDQKKLRWVLIMIITNFCVLHLPVSGLYLAINVHPDNAHLTHVFSIYEKIQLTGFSVQEWIIAGLYIWGAYHTLNPILKFKGPREKKVIRHLVLVNLLVIAMDGSLLVTEFTNNFEIQTTYKTVVYSIKLKLEFYVLNQLLFIIHNPTCTCSNSHALVEYDAAMSDRRLLPSRSACTFRNTLQRSDTGPSTKDTTDSIQTLARARTRSV
ncbi:integral membrane protein [Paraphaeosphaeria minitans]|uniref:Integral membrane protein n=1 Tax=Paraphaeosphaeria minitans TaxID=565426 RepID=A0A9P6KMU6_9PLEO|nr:integral membrane protein [Paraphaeosphaeria minitans]